MPIPFHLSEMSVGEMSVGEMSVHCTVGEMTGSVKSRSVKGRSVIYHCTEKMNVLQTISFHQKTSFE
jgi:hypothetical protein